MYIIISRLFYEYYYYMILIYSHIHIFAAWEIMNYNFSCGCKDLVIYYIFLLTKFAKISKYSD